MVDVMDHHHNWGILVGREADAVDCIECGKCEQACTQHLDIIKRLAELVEWEKQLEEKSQ
jgi:hypothetical protein